MNTVAELLAKVHDHGAELVPEAAEYSVRIHPPTLLPDALMADLRQNKTALLAYLRTCSFYRYRLRGGAGGIYRTEPRDLAGARAELAEVYGDNRLVVVAQA